MRKDVKNIELFLFLIFLIITVPLIYSLYNLQTQLAIDLGIDPLIVKDHTDVTILKLIGFFVIEIFIGCAGVFLIIRESKKSVSTDFADILDEDLYFGKKQTTTIASKKTDSHQILEQTIVTEIQAIPKKITLKEFCNQSIGILSKSLDISQGIFFTTKTIENKKYLQLTGGYAYYKPDDGETMYSFGEGLAGQVAKAQKTINIKNVPDGYIQIISGLGKSSPNSLLIVPLIDKNQTIGVMELASFNSFDAKKEQLIQNLSALIVKELTSKMKEANSENKPNTLS